MNLYTHTRKTSLAWCCMGVLAILPLYGKTPPDSSVLRQDNNRMQPWVYWVRNPVGIPATVNATNILAETSSTIVIKLDEKDLIAVNGSGYSESTNASAGTLVKIRKEYLLTVQAPELLSFDLEFAA